MAELQVTESATIPGLFIIQLVVFGDSRGSFREVFQAEKMQALGLPDFQPIQQNISYNQEVGVTRGIHGEPWEKLINIAYGKAFGAWVDLRKGPTFGAVHTEEMTTDKAFFVSRGIANSYQTLEENTVYSYLVNAHWSPDAEYSMLNLRDKKAAIEWPIPLEQAIISEKDEKHPHIEDVTPVEI